MLIAPSAIHLDSHHTVVEPASTLEALVLAHSKRCVIAFDANVRPGIEPNRVELMGR